jgi:hypothetical protein
VKYQDDGLAVVERDIAKAYIVASPEYAAKDRPEIAIETYNIQELFDEISTRRWRARPILSKWRTASR